ncbi:cell invasion protein [Pseudomonas citrulli]|uniref:Cell invasion protein n=1 Tax=Pseudomonas citrulli TaxID=3064347 RepID=A0ABT9BW73_9PSED|nr:cell invasion protein [Pseudomonas sp. K18]MDO7896747.1 cell invasion protein [Pseudomonas sp. K18]
MNAIEPTIRHFTSFDVQRGESIAQKPYSNPLTPFTGAALFDEIIARQILQDPGDAVFSAAELENAIDAYSLTEADWQTFMAASMRLDDKMRSELTLDPGAWEKHANVLVAAIIALNIARVTNGELRGHFTVMAAEAAKAQGRSIMESGKAALYSAITAAVVSGAVAGFALVKTLHGQALKHADINLHRRNALDAGNVERDLKMARNREEWDPKTPCKISTFDDFGRPVTVDFQPKGSTLTPQEQAWFDGEILKAQKIDQTSSWLSQMGSRSIDKKLEIGRALSAMSMNLSQVVSSVVRLTEHAAREREVLQQSAQNSQKSLVDEITQKDAAEAALLQKLMDLVMQLFQSRTDVIRALTA